MKLTTSQIKTLAVLRSFNSWADHMEIVSGGGSCASLPRLVELGLAERVGEQGAQSWRIAARAAEP